MKKAALVTGAAGDIGKATAVALSRNGFAVAVTDVDESALEKTLGAVKESGGDCVSRRLDVTNRAEVESVVEEVSEALGDPVSVLVNCAGNLKPTKAIDIPEQEWDSIVAVNLKGTFLCSQAVLPGMLERGWGRIINVSSTAGKNVSTVGGAHYTAAKAGVLGFTRHLASEVATDGVTVNAVCPGLIETQMISNTISRERMDDYARSFPIPRLGRPDEVAAMITFLASDDASYVTGASFDINGGDLMI